MGYGPTDAKTLVGFLELPSSAKIDAHLAVVEKTLGPVQEKMKLELQKEALAIEVDKMKRRGMINHHECTIEGHEHRSLPLLKVSYGNVNN